MGKIPPDALNYLNEVAAAIGGLRKDAAGLRLAQYVSGFVAKIGGIDRDERDAGQRGAELKENPFGRVGGLDRHVLTGREAGQKRARNPLGGFENIAKAPLAPAWLKGAVNEGWTRTVSRGGLSQRRADRLVQNRFRLVSWPVGVGRAVRVVCAQHHVLPDVSLAGNLRFSVRYLLHPRGFARFLLRCLPFSLRTLRYLRSERETAISNIESLDFNRTA
jgi:hypothetical protein